MKLRNRTTGKIFEDCYLVVGGYLEAADSLEELAARFETYKEPEIPETVYGYPTEELVKFAKVCSEEGVENSDLKTFALNAQATFEIMERAFNKEHERLANIFKSEAEK